MNTLSMNTLYNKYKNTDNVALLLATGPSINIFKEYLRNLPSNYIVFCIKSAIDAVPQGRCDYHLLNNMKLKKYDYTKYRYTKKPFVVYSSVGKKEPKVNCDLRIRLKGPSISRSHNYTELLKFHNLKKSGPGIMYDLALPFIYYLGFNTVYICGWDLFPIGQPSNLHFDGNYGHKKTRNSCLYKGKLYNESDIINLMSGNVYDECIKNNFKLKVLAHNDCNLDSKIPRMFAPLFHFDPFNYLLLNYQELYELSLTDAWTHRNIHQKFFITNYTNEFFLHYVCCYDDVSEIVLNKIKHIDFKDFNSIFDEIISVAQKHYFEYGMNEILSYKRKINIFDAWCYIASFSENKHHYLNHEHTLDYIKVYYNWITIGFPQLLFIPLNNHILAKQILIGK